MRKSSKKEKVFRKMLFKNLTSEKSDIEIIRSAWNNLPDDTTHEERIIFIELIEKTVKIYNKAKRLNTEEEKMNKN